MDSVAQGYDDPLKERIIELLVGTNESIYEKTADAILRLLSAEVERATADARIDENKYYAKLLKLNEKSADDKTSIKVSLRKVFEYRLKQLATLTPRQPEKEK